MFDKFGKMDLDGINAKAEELINAGDEKGIKKLVQENGLPIELQSLYLEGETDYLCEDITDAALGRIEIEAKDLGTQEIMGDWTDYIRSLIMDHEDIAKAVMNPEKSLKGCIGRIAVYSLIHAAPMNKDLIKAMDEAVTDAQLKRIHLERRHLQWTKIGTPGMGTAKRLIRDYYEEV